MKIDLGREVVVSEIHLTVAQFPPGATTHRLTWALHDHTFVGERIITGTTAKGNILIETWDLGDVVMRFIRIATTVSPSWVAWREIEIFGVSLP